MNNLTDLPTTPPWGLKKEYMRKIEKERSRGGEQESRKVYRKKNFVSEKAKVKEHESINEKKKN